MNPETLRVDDNFLTIDNTGGPVCDLSVGSIFSLDINAASPGPPVRTFALLLPLTTTFQLLPSMPLVKDGWSPQWVIITTRPVDAFTRALREGAEHRRLLYADAEERVHTRLFYRDILDREHEEYYLVVPVYGGTRISNEEGKDQFEARGTKSRPLSDYQRKKYLTNS
jgi:hypothetical protein